LKTARPLAACALLALSGCGSAPAPGGRPAASGNARGVESTEVAIDEPEDDVDTAVADEPVPVANRATDAELAGEWIEDWPDRGGCADHVVVRANGLQIELSGSDCNDGEAYEYRNVELDGRRLSFRLRVKSTDRVLEYELELNDRGELVGPVSGGAEATVTWRRSK
jgi:hypothetical protein